MHVRYIIGDSWDKMALGKSAHQNVDVIECACQFPSCKAIVYKDIKRFVPGDNSLRAVGLVKHNL